MAHYVLKQVSLMSFQNGHYVMNMQAEFRLRAKDAGYRKEERRVGRRETFTENEWNNLTSYLRSYRDGSGIFKNDRTHKGHKRQREMFYCYVAFYGECWTQSRGSKGH